MVEALAKRTLSGSTPEIYKFQKFLFIKSTEYLVNPVSSIQYPASGSIVKVMTRSAFEM
jgi:hypothetical protein